jgi:translation initiation factor 3 subunit B
MDNGYVIHTFKGNRVHAVLKDRFFQFLWRPRPPSLLTTEQEKEIYKNIKVYAEKYKEKDAGNITVIIDEQNLERQRTLTEFRERMQTLKDLYSSQREVRLALRGGRDSDDEADYDVFSSVVEEVIEETEEECI